MIKLHAESLRKYTSIILSSFIKGNKLTESIYFNFDDSYLYFSNYKYNARLKFEYEVLVDKIPNFFVDISCFIALIKQYSYLNIDSNFEFSTENEKFKILTFVEPNYKPLEFNYIKENWEKSSLSGRVIENIKIASKYIQTINIITPESVNLNGVMLRNNYILATDKFVVFRAISEIEFKNEINLSDHILIIFSLIINILKNDKLDFINIFYRDDVNCVVVGDKEFEIVCPKIFNMVIPDFTDPSYKSLYDHKNFFTFNKTEMINILQFFNPFVKQISNEKITFNIIAENCLDIKVDSEIRGNRLLELTKCSSEIVGQSFFISRHQVIKALNTIEDDNIKIQFNNEKEAINIVGVEKDERHIMIGKLKDITN